jgi:hypothetical protein
MSDETNGTPTVETRGLRLTGDAETEAHMPYRRSSPPEAEAHAALRISFPPDAQEQTRALTYRPPAAPGDEPEVEVHGYIRWSDVRLKRDIRAA